jgi:hypothetical protein
LRIYSAKIGAFCHFWWWKMPLFSAPFIDSKDLGHVRALSGGGGMHLAWAGNNDQSIHCCRSFGSWIDHGTIVRQTGEIIGNAMRPCFQIFREKHG